MILACDPGLANGGWAVVRPRTGVVVDFGVVSTKPDARLGKNVDRLRRLDLHLFELLARITFYGCTTIAAEAIQLPHGRSSADASASAYMTWAMLRTIASLRDMALLEVRAQQWQRAVLPNADPKRLDYAQVYVALETYVALHKREELLAITKSKREHALDAVGVGVYAALRTDADAAAVGVAT